MGGNVAAYFCTPDLKVIQVITGNVSADAFLQEAKFAVEVSKRIRNTCFDEARILAGEALGSRSITLPVRWSPPPSASNVLKENPLSHLEEIFKIVFESILREKVSDKDVVIGFRFGWLNDRPLIQRKAARP